ncbi:hypothetical protein DM02DRAFT_654037 [Periconia macrospinosa]|uniref:Uncharacterized protein n=1 Tax=Periconia macrospinosa TaxID=97972 RepID=A0A2V1DU91_9PLEO|nr:hypothetical protein DM02DRAFT_654037 [Periconia macrospinosa]
MEPPTRLEIVLIAAFAGTVLFVTSMAMAHYLHGLRRERLEKKNKRNEEIAQAIRRSRASLGTLPNVHLSSDTLPDNDQASLHVQAGGSPRNDFEEIANIEERVEGEGHGMSSVNDVYGQPSRIFSPPGMAYTVPYKETAMSPVGYADVQASRMLSSPTAENAVQRQASVMSYASRGYGQASRALSPPEWQHSVRRQGSLMSHASNASRYEDRSASPLGLKSTSTARRPGYVEEGQQVQRPYQVYDPVGKRTIYYESKEQAFGGL